ncbi:MAG: hypothetical protein Q7U76_06600, partial [Nitrospirota bacterium]|nr:hypothetical protein [Nitrospirota bacterium]
MFIHPDQKAPVARLLQFLRDGEYLASDCAKAQSKLATNPLMRRFLLSQARQESYHAFVFQGNIAWLAPRHLGACPLLPPMERYRTLIEDAIRRGDFAETLMAEQIILEGLGQAILERIEEGLAKRNAPFERMRRMLIQQEEAHHGFGCRTLERMFAAGVTSPEALRDRGQEYLALTHDMVATLGDLFTSIEEDATAWASDVGRYVPEWLNPAIQRKEGAFQTDSVSSVAAG